MRLGKLKLKKPLSLYLATAGLVHLADYILIPVLPVLLSMKGCNAAQIGFLIGCGAITFQIGSVLGGLISDNLGRKVVLMIGTSIAIISLIGHGLSHNFYNFLIFECLYGLGTGVFPPTIKAAIAEHAGERKTMAFSLRGVLANLGVALGGLIPLVFPKLPFSAFFFGAALFYSIVFIPLILLPHYLHDAQSKHTLKDYKDLLANKRFLLFNLLVFFVWALYIQLRFLLPLKGKLLFTQINLIGSIFSITSLFVIIAQTFIAKRIITRINYITSIIIGTFAMGGGILLMGYARSYVILLLSSLIFITGEMFIAPAIDSITSEFAEKELFGAYFSFVNLTYGLASGFGLFISGQLVHQFGNHSVIPWLCVAISSLFIAILIYFSKDKVSSKTNYNIKEDLKK